VEEVSGSPGLFYEEIARSLIVENDRRDDFRTRAPISTDFGL